MPTPRIHNPYNNAADAQDLADANLISALAAAATALRASISAHTSFHAAGGPVTATGPTFSLVGGVQGDAPAYAEVYALALAWSQAQQAAAGVTNPAAGDVMPVNFVLPR